MPVQGQSNAPYTGDPFTGFSIGNQYKGSIDSDRAVAAPLSGLFFVYQNSPTGMNVLVDVAYNFYYSGGVVQQPTAAPVVVALTAPTINPYIACIYWDSLTNTFGVAYGAQASSPVPQFPDWATQKPLALVTIPVGAASITSAMIVDIRSGFLAHGKKNFTSTITAATALDISSCPDAEVWLNVNTAAQTLTITCRYLQKILIAGQTNSGTKALAFAFKTPSGVTIPAFAAVPAWAQLASATGWAYSGGTMGGTGFNFFSGNANTVMFRSFWNPGAPQLFFS